MLAYTLQHWATGQLLHQQGFSKGAPRYVLLLDPAGEGGKPTKCYLLRLTAGIAPARMLLLPSSCSSSHPHPHPHPSSPACAGAQPMIGVVSNSSYSSQSNVTIRVGETPMQPASGTASSERLVPITLVVAIGVASGLLLLGAGFCIMWLRRSNRLAGEAGAADDNKGSLQVGRLIDHDGLG